jgi:glycerophosphoryl diester phosphodiesterase
MEFSATWPEPAAWPAPWPSPDGRPLVIAHRGFSGRAAENLRTAFVFAIEAGADGVECDVHLTRDDELVVIHDSDVARMSDGAGRVEDMTLAELRRLRWGAERDRAPWPGSPELGQPFHSRELLTLAQLIDLLKLAPRPVRLFVETKQPAPRARAMDRAVARVLREAGWDRPGPGGEPCPVTVISFDPRSLRAVAHAGFQGDLIQLIPDGGLANLVQAGEPARQRRLSQMAVKLLAGRAVTGIGPSVAALLHHPMVQPVHGRAMPVYTWTANTAGEVTATADAGATAIATDYPDMALRALHRRPAASLN